MASNGGREPVANDLRHYMQATSRLAKRVAVLEDALAKIETLAGEGIEDVDLYEAITDLTRIGYERV